MTSCVGGRDGWRGGSSTAELRVHRVDRRRSASCCRPVARLWLTNARSIAVSATVIRDHSREDRGHDPCPPLTSFDLAVPPLARRSSPHNHSSSIPNSHSPIMSPTHVRRPLSCEGCRVRKRRCDRGEPCVGCLARREPCLWLRRPALARSRRPRPARARGPAAARSRPDVAGSGASCMRCGGVVEELRLVRSAGWAISASPSSRTSSSLVATRPPSPP
jgi:hypothetical protein